MGFLRDLNQNISADRERPVYKLLHLMLSHNPMITTNSCEYAGGVLPTVRETVIVQAGCGLAEVIRLLEQMKRLGIYDDATIILMADHGAWVPPSRLRVKRNAAGQPVASINPSIVALAAPLLAIKEAGASGPLRISTAPTWVPDIAPTIASLGGFTANYPGPSALDIAPDVDRERPFYYYQYSRGEWTADYLSPIREFIIKGSVFDTSAWHRSARFPPRLDTH